MLTDIVSLFFPSFCTGCRRTLMHGEDVICLHCRSSLRSPSQMVMQAFRAKFLFPLEGSYVHWRFIQYGTVQRIVHSIKYGGRQDVCRKLGEDMGSRLNGMCGVLVPVPQHPARLMSRGFNQAEVLARGIAERSGLAMDTQLLKRAGPRQSLTKKRSRIHRLYSLENSIQWTGKAIPGTVVLVDDVVTTGATLQTCASRLFEAGATRIGVIALATV